MPTDLQEGVARDLWRLIEPIHAVTYFSPEPLAALAATGYRGFWMGYFAGRAAPLGAASAELVQALFYNFSREHIAAALPDAWSFAPPQAALAARHTGSVAALRRHLGDDVALAGAAEQAGSLLLAAANSAPAEGRPLFAANLAQPAPTGGLERLWYAATLLREHRGDGHLAALAVAGLNGREAIVLHATATDTPQQVYAVARRFSELEWAAVTVRLRERGLLDTRGEITASGLDLHRRVEQVTDRLASTAYAGLDDAQLQELTGALRPITLAVLAAGEIPLKSPIGIDLSQLPTLGSPRGPAAQATS